MTKSLSKKEIKARKAEVNRKVNKKRDFRKFANKMFKNPTDHLPLKISGVGAGTIAYCYDCGIIAGKIVIKEGGKVICRTCDGNNIEFRTKTPSIWQKIYWGYKEFIYGRQHRK